MKAIQICMLGLTGSGKTELTNKLQQRKELEDEHYRVSSFKQADSLVYVADTPYTPENVKTMLALMNESDACVLCVDATQAMNPKLGELVLFLNYMGHATGIVAITKTDMTTPDVVDTLKRQMSAVLSESTLKEVQMIGVSTVTEEGLSDLRSALVNLSPKDRDVALPFKLPVETAQEVKSGITNIIGVIESGTLKKYDKTYILPWGKEFIVQEINLHGQIVEEAKAGDRVLIQYKGLNKWDVQTGDVVCAEGLMEKAKTIKCEIEVSKFFKDKFRQGSEVQLNIGMQTLSVDVVSMTKNGSDVSDAESGDKVVATFETKIPYAIKKDMTAIVYNPEAHWKSIKVVGSGKVLEGSE